jgi:hypothetical protein
MPVVARLPGRPRAGGPRAAHAAATASLSASAAVRRRPAPAGRCRRRGVLDELGGQPPLVRQLPVLREAEGDQCVRAGGCGGRISSSCAPASTAFAAVARTVATVGPSTHSRAHRAPASWRAVISCPLGLGQSPGEGPDRSRPVGGHAGSPGASGPRPLAASAVVNAVRCASAVSARSRSRPAAASASASWRCRSVARWSAAAAPAGAAAHPAR